MALQRANPVPPGVYWVDVPGPATGPQPRTRWAESSESKRQDFEAWRKKYADRVTVLETKSGDEIAWYLFEVSKSVPWDAVKFGYPTIGKRGMHQGDTIQAPDLPKTGTDAITEAIEQAGSRAIGIGLFALGVWWVIRNTGGKKR